MTQALSGVPNWTQIAAEKYGLKRSGTEQPAEAPIIVPAQQAAQQAGGDSVSFKGRYAQSPYGGYPQEESGGIGLTPLLVGAASIGALIYGVRKGKLDSAINWVKNKAFYQEHLQGGKIARGIKKLVDFIKPKNAAETAKAAS